MLPAFELNSLKLGVGFDCFSHCSDGCPENRGGTCGGNDKDGSVMTFLKLLTRAAKLSSCEAIGSVPVLARCRLNISTLEESASKYLTSLFFSSGLARMFPSRAWNSHLLSSRRKFIFSLDTVDEEEEQEEGRPS